MARAIRWGVPDARGQSVRSCGVSLRISRYDTVTLLELSGDLDLQQVGSISDQVRQACVESDGPVVLDTAGVEFVDSMGLRLLIEARGDAGHGLTIRNASIRLMKLLTITGLQEQFDFDEGDQTGR